MTRTFKYLLREYLPGILTIVLLLVAWEAYSRSQDTPFIPSLALIASSFADNWLFERVPIDLVPSLERLAVGYSVSLFLGVGLGAAIGSYAPLRRTIMPTIEFLRSLPSTALVPFAIVAFGFGMVGKAFLIVFAGTWPILLNVSSAVANLNPLTLDAARAYRIPRLLRIRKIVIPAVMPPLMAGARTSLGIALIMVVVSEMFASTSGIGHYVVQAERTFQLANMWSGVLLIGLVGYSLNAAFLAVQHRVLRGHGPTVAGTSEKR